MLRQHIQHKLLLTEEPQQIRKTFVFFHYQRILIEIATEGDVTIF